MQCIAIDVGHGFTKGLHETGRRLLLPSWIASAGAVTDVGHILPTAQPDRVTWGLESSASYWVGAEAARHATSLLTRDKGHNRFVRDLTAIMLHRLDPIPGDPIHLAVGLPLAWYKEERQALARSLTGQVIVNDQMWSIARVTVWPQGVTAVLQVLNPTSPHGWYGLVDVGYGTTEYLIADVTDHGPRLAPEPSGTWDLGLHDVAMALAQVVEATWQVNYGPHELDERDHIIVRGQVMSLDPWRDPLLDQWRTTLINHIQATWGSLLPRLQGLIMIGGAAPLLSGQIIGSMPVTIPAEPQWANVQGFMRAIHS
jgi:hypothetical protein